MKTLGYLTDAIFHQLNGEMVDRGEYYLIRTPSNPTFYWGNFLLFKSEPTAGCIDHWLTIHRAEFGDSPSHTTIGWDSDAQGDTSDFEALGFQLHENIVLSLPGPPLPVKTNPALELRKLNGERDWQESIDLQVNEGFEGENEASYRIFKTDQMANYRLNQERGRGHWWGAFLNDTLVGDMGLFFDEAKKVGRFQNVTTAQPHRRIGVCTSLLNHIIRETQTDPHLEHLVIVTEHGSIAEKIYRSLGFQKAGLQFGLCRNQKTAPAES